MSAILSVRPLSKTAPLSGEISDGIHGGLGVGVSVAVGVGVFDPIVGCAGLLVGVAVAVGELVTSGGEY